MSLLVQHDKARDFFVLFLKTWLGVINLLLWGPWNTFKFNAQIVIVGFSLQRLLEPRGSWGCQSQTYYMEVDCFDLPIWYLVQPQALLCVIMTTFLTDIIFPLRDPFSPRLTSLTAMALNGTNNIFRLVKSVLREVVDEESHWAWISVQD